MRGHPLTCYIGDYSGVERLGKELETGFRFPLYSYRDTVWAGLGFRHQKVKDVTPSLVGNKADGQPHPPVASWGHSAKKYFSHISEGEAKFQSLRDPEQTWAPPFQYWQPSRRVFCRMLRPTYWMVLCKNCTCRSCRGSPSHSRTVTLCEQRGTPPAPVKHFLNPCLHHSTSKPCPSKLWVLGGLPGPVCVSVCLCVYVWVCVCRTELGMRLPLHPKDFAFNSNQFEDFALEKVNW